MAQYTVEVAEVHYASYVIEANSPEQARREVFVRGALKDGGVEFSHVLGCDHKVYDEDDCLVLD